MAFASTADLEDWLSIPHASHGWWLDRLGVGLTELRRPSGREGEWDVQRYLSLPPALRAATVYWTLRAEISNGGADQFVWNQFAILPATLEALLHIGAFAAAANLVELAEAHLESDDEGDDAVESFLQFRSSVPESAWDASLGVVEDVRLALLAHARRAPEEFVILPIETFCWTNPAHVLRASLLQRPDARYEVLVEIQVSSDGAPSQWFELPHPPNDVPDLASAQAAFAQAIEARRDAVRRCTFALASCSKAGEGGFRVWPEDRLPLDALPLGAISATFLRDGEVFTVPGSFIAETTGDRAYGKIVVETVPPETLVWPVGARRWRVRCSA